MPVRRKPIRRGRFTQSKSDTNGNMLLQSVVGDNPSGPDWPFLRDYGPSPAASRTSGAAFVFNAHRLLPAVVTTQTRRNAHPVRAASPVLRPRSRRWPRTVVPLLLAAMLATFLGCTAGAGSGKSRGWFGTRKPQPQTVQDWIGQPRLDL